MSFRPRWPSGPLLGALLGLACLAVCAWVVSDDLLFSSGRSKILASVLSDGALSGPLGWRITAFVLALLAIHALVGVLAWSLARLTARAWPGLRLGERTLTLLWVTLLAAWVVAVNGADYPASSFAGYPKNPDDLRIPWAALALGLQVMIGAAVLLTVARWALRQGSAVRPSARVRTALGLTGGLAVAAGLLGNAGLWDAARPAGPAADAPASLQQPAAGGRPRHIIVIGLDSLRCDLPVAGATAALTPNIARFLAGSHRFEDATTPLARTYASWVSILTGRHPVTTGARVNLTPRALVHTGETLPESLRREGYHTVYATDEVRFANIDQSYGFDQLITPPIGASDFLLGQINDLPLSNVLSVVPGYRWLFPHTAGNRAAYVTYRPAAFDSRLDELDGTRPTFLALHLTLPHWPYSWAGQPYTESQPKLLRAAYEKAAIEVDVQFARVMALLQRKGLLQDALVVILSDHGEGMGYRTESLLQDVRPLADIWGSVWGHGTSVMTPHQFQVVLAFRGYGRAALAATPGANRVPASLEDISPTVLELVGVPTDPGVDGLSLAPVLRGAPVPDRLANRVRFTETDFNTESMLKGRFDAKGALSEAGLYYEVDPASGWVQLKADRLPEIFAAKERAAFDRDWLLAALPDGHGGHEYLATRRQRPLPARVYARPSAAEHPEVARLWDALHARFPGELPGLPAAAADAPRAGIAAH